MGVKGLMNIFTSPPKPPQDDNSKDKDLLIDWLLDTFIYILQ